MLRAVVETMEDRILHSADAWGLAAPEATPGAALVQRADSAVLARSEAQQASRHEIAFVDASLPELNRLLAALQPTDSRQLELVLIAPDEDGFARIGATLAERQDIAAVHLITHGSDGRVQLGRAVMDSNSLLRHAGTVADWGQALTADADWLIYGCDVAASAPGLALLHDLAALTGADVAASDDRTGSALLGADWQLEQQTGPVETAALAPAATAGAADWQGLLANEAQANATTVGNQSLDALDRGAHQALDVADDGSYVLVWTSAGQDGSGNGVYARRFAADGTPLTGDILVPSTTLGNQTHAGVASDAAGNFVVTWSDDGNGGDGAVMFRRFAADGTAIGAAQNVSAFTTGTQTNPTIAHDPSNGGFVVAWQGVGAGDTLGVWMRRFDAAGNARDASDILVRSVSASSLGLNLALISVEVDNVDVPRHAALAVDATGRVVVGYDLSEVVYVQRFSAAGAAQGSAVGADPTGWGKNFTPAIAMDANGRFAVVYRETNISPGVWVRGFNADGSAWFASSQVGTGDADSPDIAIAPDGRFLVTFQKTGAIGIEVYARHYTASGATAGAAYILNATTTGDQVKPSIAAVNPYQYAVAWSGNVPGDSAGIALRTFQNTAPAIGSNGGGASANVTVSENATAVTTVQATDPDLPAQTLTYSITGGADAALFSINASTGALRFVTAPNFEAPADAGANNVYDVVVAVSDGLDADTQALAVTVTDQAISTVSVSGAATVNTGTPYTLNLTANEQATSWTINWGDGTIDTLTGNPSTATHTFTQGGFTFNILASARDAQGTVHPHQLVVPTYSGGNSVMRFAPMTGLHLQTFGANGSNTYPVQAVVGPDGRLYVSEEGSATVRRYDTATGTLVDTFVGAGSGGLSAPQGIAFGPDGHLYVASHGSNQVLRYDGTTGAFIDAFVTSVNRPFGLSFGPDGRLYVALHQDGAVQRFDGITGAPVDTFIAPGSNGLQSPGQIVFGPDGHLYVNSNGTDEVQRYNGSTGAYLGAFVTAGAGGLDRPWGMAFGPDGAFYVASFGSSDILRFDGNQHRFAG